MLALGLVGDDRGKALDRVLVVRGSKGGSALELDYVEVCGLGRLGALPHG